MPFFKLRSQLHTRNGLWDGALCNRWDARAETHLEMELEDKKPMDFFAYSIFLTYKCPVDRSARQEEYKKGQQETQEEVLCGRG